MDKKIVDESLAALVGGESPKLDKESPFRKKVDNLVKKMEGSAQGPTTSAIPNVLNTEALRKEQLEVGRFYRCILSGDRKVQYIGNDTIKWYSPNVDEYRTAEVTDYQLRPLSWVL